MAPASSRRWWLRAWALLGLLALSALHGPRAAAEDTMVEPRFREGRAGDVLVRGEPSLLRGHLDAFVDLTESAFDVALAAAGEQELRDALELAFGGWSAAERSAFLDLVTPVTGLREKGRRGEVDALKAGLRAFWLALDRRIAAAPREKAHRLLTQALERRQRPVWRGIPAIHGSAADAWLEATLFLSQVGRNEVFEPTEGQRQALEAELDVGLHGQSEALRERLKGFHRQWLLVKARWDEATQAQRLKLRFEAVRALARLLPAGRAPDVTAGGDLPAYAQAASRVGQQVTAYDAWSNAARNPEVVLAALAKGLDLPEPLPEHTLLYR